LRPTALLMIALFLSLSCPAQGESSAIAELRAKIEQYTKNDALSNDTVIAALELQQLAHSEKDLAAEVYAFKSLGDTYTWLGAYEQALRAYESSAGIYDVSLGLELQGQLYFAMSSLLIEMESYEEGLKLLDSAAAIAEETGDKLMSAILEVNRASVLSATDESFAAEQALEHASAYFKSVGHERHYGRARNDIGMIYKERSEYEAALAEFGTVLELAKRTNDTSLTVYALLELGDIKRITGNYQGSGAEPGGNGYQLIR